MKLHSFICFYLSCAVVLCHVVQCDYSETSLRDLEKIPHLRKLISRMKKQHKHRLEHPLEPSHGETALHQQTTESQTVALVSTEKPGKVRGTPQGKRSNKQKGKTSVADAKSALEQKGRGRKKVKVPAVAPSSASSASAETDTSSEHTKAIRHERMVRKSAKCGVPSPRLVRVREVHRDDFRATYIPHCTWLHRCQDDTACCPSESQTCAVAAKEDVELYFHKIPVGGRGSVVRLVFENHTSCECRERLLEQMPRTEAHVLGSRLDDANEPTLTSTAKFSYPAPTVWASSIFNLGQMESKQDDASRRRFNPAADDDFSEADAHQRFVNATSDKCQCVGDYDLVSSDDGECLCDCFELRKKCLRLKQGKYSFFLRDRRCIEQGRCAIPSCKYGRYIQALGRCPRRNERDAHWLKLLEST